MEWSGAKVRSRDSRACSLINCARLLAHSALCRVAHYRAKLGPAHAPLLRPTSIVRAGRCAALQQRLFCRLADQEEEEIPPESPEFRDIWAGHIVAAMHHTRIVGVSHKSPVMATF